MLAFLAYVHFWYLQLQRKRRYQIQEVFDTPLGHTDNNPA